MRVSILCKNVLKYSIWQSRYMHKTHLLLMFREKCVSKQTLFSKAGIILLPEIYYINNVHVGVQSKSECAF